MDKGKDDKKGEHQLYIRSVNSAPFSMPQPGGRPGPQVYGEVSAAYVETEEDVDGLLQLLAAARDYITTLEIPKKDGSGNRYAVILRGVFPAKVTTLAGGKEVQGGK